VDVFDVETPNLFKQVATTVFPNIKVTTFTLIGGALLAIGLAAFGLVTLRTRRRAPAVIEEQPSIPREQWGMVAPVTLLGRPQWSTGRKVAMLTLRGYLVASVILLIVKAIQLGGG
jgi:hypothetical protein